MKELHWRHNDDKMNTQNDQHYLVNVQTDSLGLIIPLVTITAVPSVEVSTDSIEARVSDETLV